MAKGAQKARAAAVKAEKRAASVARRQVLVDTALLVEGFEEALADSVYVVCDDCGHEFMESTEFSWSIVLPCLLCGCERATTHPRHDEVMAAVRERLTRMRVDIAA